MKFNKGDFVRVNGYGGIAFWFVGPEIEKYWDYDAEIFPDEPEERETGRVIVIMVGDDHRHSVDPEDLSPLNDDEFCSECGQIGCGHAE